MYMHILTPTPRIVHSYFTNVDLECFSVRDTDDSDTAKRCMILTNVN